MIGIMPPGFPGPAEVRSRLATGRLAIGRRREPQGVFYIRSLFPCLFWLEQADYHDLVPVTGFIQQDHDNTEVPDMHARKHRCGLRSQAGEGGVAAEE